VTRNRILVFVSTLLFSIALVSVLHFTVRSVSRTIEPNLSRKLYLATERGEITRMRLLIFLGADVNSKVYSQYFCANMTKEDRERDYDFALQSAALEGQTEAVELLLNQGADVNITDGYGRTALWFAALGGKADTARLLILKGANVNPAKGISDYATTPLEIASEHGNQEVIKILLENGAKE
jgi:ankyrin repeat protein